MKNPIHKQMIEEFHAWYEIEKGFKFIWDVKHIKQIDVIFNKLVKACEHNDTIADELVVGAEYYGDVSISEEQSEVTVTTLKRVPR